MKMAVKGFKELVKETTETIEEQPARKRKSAFAGMLNEASKKEKLMEEMILVPISDIIPNEKNEKIAGMRDIEELMANIYDVGLQQPLVAYQQINGKWKLLAGHRRFEACKRLYEDGDERFAKLPVIDRKPADIDLPLSEQQKEDYIMISTNIETRTEYTPQERYEQYRLLNQIFDTLDKAGQKPKGRRRELIADEMKMNSQSVARYESIEKKATNQVKKEFIENDMDFTAATTLSKEEPEVQDKVLKMAKKEAKKTPEKKVTKSMVEEALKEVKEEEPEEENLEAANNELIEDEVNEREDIDVSVEFNSVVVELSDLQLAYRNAPRINEETYRKLKKETSKLMKQVEAIQEILKS